MKMKVQAQHLQPGDIVGSGETIVKAECGLHTPKGKVEVYLRSNGGERGVRRSDWGKYTLINVERSDG